MALPTKDNNIVGTHILPVTDLGLSASLPNATPEDSDAFSTGIPGVVLVVAQLSSGTRTIDIKVEATGAAALAGLGSPTATMSLSSTTKMYQTVTTTNNLADIQGDDGTAADSDLWVALRQTGGAGGSILQQFGIFVLYELVGGEDWFSVRTGANAVAGGTGIDNVSVTEPTGFQDGTGAFVLTAM